jgi:hypothetical protein
MSSPTTPKATATTPPSASSSRGSAEKPATEIRDFSDARRAPTGFGSRLANARNLRPDAAPPAPPVRTTTYANPFMDGGVSLLPRAQPFFTGEEAPFKPMPKYGGVKGSYVSPYDGGGRVPGGKHLPFSSTTVEEFEAKFGTAARLASAAAEGSPSGDSVSSERTVAPAPTSPPKKEVAPSVPQDVSQLILFTQASVTNYITRLRTTSSSWGRSSSSAPRRPRRPKTTRRCVLSTSSSPCTCTRACMSSSNATR